jgi:hypothetical protein
LQHLQLPEMAAGSGPQDCVGIVHHRTDEYSNRPPDQWFERLPGRLELVMIGSYVPRDWVRVAQG